MPFLYSPATGGVGIRLYVQPKASRTKIVGLFDDRLKIAVAAPPADGKANGVVVKFLAGLLRVPVKDVVLKSGSRSRRKTVVVQSLEGGFVRGLLMVILEGADK